MRSHLTLLFLLFFASCTPSVVEETATTEADIGNINKASEEFVAAARANDTEELVSLYAADAVLMSPNEPVSKGSEGIQTWMQSFFDQFTMVDFNISAQDVVVTGDWAFRRGNFAMTVSPIVGGEQMQDLGKFVDIWQRQSDGSWKIYWNIIWNSDNPSPSRCRAKPSDGTSPKPA